MTKKMKWKLLAVIAITALAIWRSYPPFDILNEKGEVVEKGKINLGLDLRGGVHLALEVELDKLPEEARKDATDRALEIIRNRIDRFGVLEPYIQKEGINRIIIQLPGFTDVKRAADIVGKTAHLEFVLVSDDPEVLKKALNNEPTPGYVLKTTEKESLLLEDKPSLTGDKLVDASVEFSQQQFGQPYVSLTLNPEGAKIFSDLTAVNVDKRLAIVLDGVVKSAPVIRERIPSGRAQITGSFSVDEANDLAIVLRSGALPAPTKIIEERAVGPSLGKDSIRDGLRATFIAAALVFVFMAIYYLLLGLVANVALFLNLVLIFGALAYFGGTLTLPGIAGLVLTIGMSVDANVLIYERIREELETGKHIQSAVSMGFQRAFLTIFDSNLTTLISALILFQFGTGPIRGFATTLSIGLIANVFTAVFVCRIIIDIMVKGMHVTKFQMLQFFRKPNINFAKFRYAFYILSAVVIAVGMIAFAARGPRNFGVEFTGGTIEQLRFEKPLSLDLARNALKEIGLGTSAIQQFGEDKEIIIRTAENTSEAIITKFKETFKDNPFEVLRIESIGPTIGKELRQKALWAVFYSLIGILIYVGFRFEFKYAFTGVAALFHDAAVCLGFVALTGREVSISVIAAILTIIGYSINDTIVIFDRIREKRRLMKKLDYQDLVNISYNETLGRTVLTNLTVFMVVVALFLLGGEVIKDFAFVLIVGQISGTYSTLLAASMLIDWPGTRKVRPAVS